jgi:hypothetical protein
MADWRQIQARIRRAKGSADPLAKLEELFTKTHDAMVAWEMAVIEEKAGRMEEAVRWHTIAAERFRRSDWKKKAEEALVRLGAPVPVARPDSGRKSGEPEPQSVDAQLSLEAEPSSSSTASEPSESHAEPATEQSAADGVQPATGPRRRRRGRRGGRGRRRSGAAASPGLPAQTFVESARPKETAVERPPERRPEPQADAPAAARRKEIEAPAATMERVAHGRAGEPAIASRLAHLESLLRRLTSGPLHALDEADDAPAGPGVFLLSDSDLINSYYVEDCKTLRVALGHLLRGGRGAQREGSVRTRLSQHLGISETKVSQYLKQHCVIRWLQLDEEAPHLAHFATAVLRPPLNFE